jgi:hypothetical protein
MWFSQEVPSLEISATGTLVWQDLDRVHWEHYWDGQPCSRCR